MIRSLPYFLLILSLLLTNCATELKPTSTTMVTNVIATATPAAAFTPFSTPMPTATPTLQPTLEPLIATPSPTIAPATTVENLSCEATNERVACSVDFHTVVMWDEQTGWVFGDKGVILYYDNTLNKDTPTWQQSDNFSVPFSLAAFSPISATEGWGVIGSEIYHYKDGKWDGKAVFNNFDLRDIIMLNEASGWAVGYERTKHIIGDGIVLDYTKDGWQKTFTLQNQELIASDIVDKERWAVGWDNIVVHLQNQQWEQVTNIPHQNFKFTDIDMVSEFEGWVVGHSIILHYQNGVWKEVASDLTESLYEPVIHMANIEEGWIVGSNGYILHYQDGQWQEADSPTENDLLSISMVSAEEGWAVGRNGTILHYQNGGWELVSEAQ